MKTQNRFRYEILKEQKKAARELLWSYVIAGITFIGMLFILNAINP